MKRARKLFSLLFLVTATLSGCSLQGTADVAQPRRLHTYEELSSAKKLGDVLAELDRDHSRDVEKPSELEILGTTQPGIAVNLKERSIHEQVSALTGRERYFVHQADAKLQHYDALFGRVFRSLGLPEELGTLAYLESRCNRHARSPYGAVGMWQFIASTARAYGLVVSANRDDRKDEVRSTVAAARLLKDLHESYGDWQLAVAAYNAGKGRIDRAIRAGGTKDFYELSRKGLIPKESHALVSRFLALNHVLYNSENYGFAMTSRRKLSSVSNTSSASRNRF